MGSFPIIPTYTINLPTINDMHTDLALLNKTALVCGSTQGIGLSIAEALALQGATCILFARNEGMLKERVAQLAQPCQQRHTYAVADFNDLEQLKKAVSRIVSENVLHILINNTGGPKAGMIAEAQSSDFESAFRQHLLANHILTQAVVPGMKSAGYGRIINIISTSVRIPIENLGVSNTIRAAVASWSKTMANELGAFGITVNSILPGFTDTQRLRTLIEANAMRRGVTAGVVEQEMKESIPAKRFGKPEEIAALAAFLVTPSAAYINGVSIPVDGGKTGTI
jgi:3-oxoacyl-[acyl-carrier protein] reductase